MPQMFPLLWFYLFLSCAMALFIMSSMVYFSGRKSTSKSSYNILSAPHSWKW